MGRLKTEWGSNRCDNRDHGIFREEGIGDHGGGKRRRGRSG